MKEKRDKEIHRPKMVLVKSKAYGKHERSPRGTFKPARLNEAMQSACDDTIEANRIAMTIKRLIDPFRTGLKDGTMWWRLLSEIRTITKREPVDFSLLNHFEFHQELPHISGFSQDSEVRLFDDKRVMDLHVETAYRKSLSRDTAKEYQQTIIAMFLSEGKSAVESRTITLPLKPQEFRSQNVRIDIPDNTLYVLVVVKCCCVENGVPVERKGRRLLQVIKAFDVESFDYEKHGKRAVGMELKAWKDARKRRAKPSL